ncbi:MAG: RES family NAD+ phosphorylase [Thermodesulfobacteriota bacterium]
MDLYRMAKREFIGDLTGGGAGTAGGRWNEKGAGVIIASESLALAALELLVHVPLSLLPGDICVATIRVPDRIRPEGLPGSFLPPGWRVYPAPAELAEIGSNWAAEGASLLLKVPSAVTEREFNFLINPHHPDMMDVRIIDIEDFRPGGRY